MKNLLLYIKIITITLITQGYCFAEDKFWDAKQVVSWLKWSDDTADVAVQTYVWRVLTFLYLAAVILIIYWWFLIFTAWSDDEKVKKWKQVIIEALIWVVVIYLANSIVKLVITWILSK